MRKCFSLTLLVWWAAACSAATAAEDQVWEKLRLPEAAQRRNLRGVYFLDGKHGWIVGDKGLCLETSDGGATWELRETGLRATLRCVQFRDAKTGWICGDGDRKAPDPTRLGQKGGAHIVSNRPRHAGTLLHTTDGGKTWKTFWIPTNFEVPWVEASTAPLLQVGVHGGMWHPDGDITRSPDGGKTWKTYRALRALMVVRAVEGKRWVAAGGRGLPNLDPNLKGELYTNELCRAVYSEDGGETWKVSKGSDDKRLGVLLRALAVGKDRPVLAVGDGGVILRSQDAGVHWEEVTSPTKARLYGVTWCGPWAIAVGEKGTVLLGTGEGKKWEQLPMKTDSIPTLNGVATAGDYAIAVGEEGTVLRISVAELAKRTEKSPQ